MGLIERKDRERAPESERERWSEIIGVQWGKREIKKGTDKMVFPHNEKMRVASHEFNVVNVEFKPSL